MGWMLRIPLTLSGRGNGVVLSQTTLLICRKALQANGNFFGGYYQSARGQRVDWWIDGSVE